MCGPMPPRIRLLSALLVTSLLAVGGKHARAEEATAPRTNTYERSGGGGFALELSAGGISGNSIEGGILAGLSVRGFVFGLFVDAERSTDVASSAPDMAKLTSGSSRVGFALRLPLLRSNDGRVSLFAGGDLAVTSRNVIARETSSVGSYRAEGS